MLSSSKGGGGGGGGYIREGLSPDVLCCFQGGWPYNRGWRAYNRNCVVFAKGIKLIDIVIIGNTINLYLGLLVLGLLHVLWFSVLVLKL